MKQLSLERLLLSETCLITYFGTSATLAAAVTGDIGQQIGDK